MQSPRFSTTIRPESLPVHRGFSGEGPIHGVVHVRGQANRFHSLPKTQSNVQHDHAEAFGQPLAPAALHEKSKASIYMRSVPPSPIAR